jgi:hypothetical protein
MNFILAKLRALRFEPMEEGKRTELEAVAFRRPVKHLRERSDVQNEIVDGMPYEEWKSRYQTDRPAA